MYCVGDACIERCWQVNHSGVSVTTLGSKNDYVLALSTQSQQGILLNTDCVFGPTFIVCPHVNLLVLIGEFVFRPWWFVNQFCVNITSQYGSAGHNGHDEQCG